MREPRYSLLVPCYNAAAYLPELWKTVRTQTLPFDEMICYDDASTDETAAVARSLGATVLRGEVNGGPAHARNQLIRAARGEWVHFHDADDLIDPGFLSEMSARGDGDRDVVICNAQWRNGLNGSIEMEWRYSEAALLSAPVSYLLQHPVGGINGLYRRSVLNQVGCFDERLAVWEDADLHVRLALAGARFAVVEKALVTAIRRSGSLSADMRRNWRNRLAALRHYAEILPPRYHPALVSECDLAAAVMVRHADYDAARAVVELARSLGGELPVTRSLLVRACRRVLGPVAALRLQSLVRHSRIFSADRFSSIR